MRLVPHVVDAGKCEYCGRPESSLEGECAVRLRGMLNVYIRWERRRQPLRVILESVAAHYRLDPDQLRWQRSKNLTPRDTVIAAAVRYGIERETIAQYFAISESSVKYRARRGAEPVASNAFRAAIFACGG